MVTAGLLRGETPNKHKKPSRVYSCWVGVNSLVQSPQNDNRLPGVPPVRLSFGSVLSRQRQRQLLYLFGSSQALWAWFPPIKNHTMSGTFTQTWVKIT
ncbi:hypothetical protein A2368_04320 [Candidatus Collierbacteria bacterium RIFOXYB1_FULL_49_13]|uniref:Uncharacterized protein n=1 Tax=Candidatus Collierbacteria bacterium RIFOXYB1_FULL_49_13 TaxID=1817728 RepID=A0A1F5FGM5_9BACT|nr:MAG: hypothetical protein A2368_04320 [Candidatus Collierbacteria bacterium RIFOXYB1_FULL_49_13]